MTNKEALKAWEKFYAEIDKENWLFVGTINPEMVSLAIKALENQPQWIPVKTRKMTAEEIEELSKSNDLIDADDIEQWCYCCKLPDDKQDVLITTEYGDIRFTTFYADLYYGCYFENYEDRDDVLAWMPLPEPYKKEETT